MGFEIAVRYGEEENPPSDFRGQSSFVQVVVIAMFYIVFEPRVGYLQIAREIALVIHLSSLRLDFFFQNS